MRRSGMSHYRFRFQVGTVQDPRVPCSCWRDDIDEVDHLAGNRILGHQDGVLRHRQVVPEHLFALEHNDHIVFIPKPSRGQISIVERRERSEVGVSALVLVASPNGCFATGDQAT